MEENQLWQALAWAMYQKIYSARADSYILLSQFQMFDKSTLLTYWANSSVFSSRSLNWVDPIISKVDSTMILECNIEMSYVLEHGELALTPNMSWIDFDIEPIPNV